MSELSMKRFLQILLSLSFIVVAPELTMAEKKDCSCPKVTCGPCQKKVNIGKIVKFCDWGDINVCRKVVCENVSYFFSCLSKHNKSRTEDAEEKSAKRSDLNFMYEKSRSEEASQKNKRSLASKAKKSKSAKLEGQGRIEVGNDSRVVVGVEYSDVVIGKTQNANKNLKILHRGQLTNFAKGKKLFVGDEISNHHSKKQKLSLVFENGTVDISLNPKSKLIVQDPESIVGRFQPFFYLVHGGMEFVAHMKEGSFDVLAGQILSRSSGGRHQVQYEMGKEGLKVKVESFKNDIEVIKAQDLSGKKIVVQAGNFVSWMSETPVHLFNSDEKQALAGEGFITPVFEMSESQKKERGLLKPKAKPLFADWTKEKLKKGRTIASLSEGLCQTPAANYQQCAWSCEGNGKGAKSCQAERVNVHCVRRVCNAAGQWGVPTAFASSYKDLCPAEGVRVGDCNP